MANHPATPASNPLNPAPSPTVPPSLPLLQPNVTAFDHAGGLASAVLGRAPWWLPQGKWSGDGTAYSEGVANTGKGFACSYRFLNDWASRNFAAINKPMVRRLGTEAVGLGWWGGS